jgi:plastocyanin
MDRRPLPRVRPLLVPLVALSLAIGIAACGDDDESNATADQGSGTTADTSGSDDPYANTSGSGDDGGEAAEGTIVAKDYSLTDITVAPGEEIVLKNEGEFAHTATADDGEFDLGQVEAGATSDPGTAPEEPGTYAFHCEIHPNMKATLTVEG